MYFVRKNYYYIDHGDDASKLPMFWVGYTLTRVLSRSGSLLVCVAGRYP